MILHTSSNFNVQRQAQKKPDEERRSEQTEVRQGRLDR